MQAINFTIGPTIFDGDVLPFLIALLAQALTECGSDCRAP
jgi:hypothetical protein